MFVGLEVITRVPPTLHTPLMSGSNAISGIVLLGALLVPGQQQDDVAAILGFMAVVLATVNAVGGFVVTDRMLRLFKRQETP
jgi:NAD(P) transhydrogenase subunit alpha